LFVSNSEIGTGNIKKFHEEFFRKLDDYVQGEIVLRIEGGGGGGGGVF